jgi:hypothetical protein
MSLLSFHFGRRGTEGHVLEEGHILEVILGRDAHSWGNVFEAFRRDKCSW